MQKGKEKGKTVIKPPSQAAKTVIPEELSSVWDKDVAAAFDNLRPQQQDFLTAYLHTGIAAAAYRKAYNPQASDHLSSVAGSRMLSSVGIELILLKFASNKTEALFTVLNGYREMAQATKADWVKDENGQYENAGDTPDWQARKEAFIGLRKIHGLDAAERIDHTVKTQVVQVELPKKT